MQKDTQKLTKQEVIAAILAARNFIITARLLLTEDEMERKHNVLRQIDDVMAKFMDRSR